MTPGELDRRGFLRLSAQGCALLLGASRLRASVQDILRVVIALPATGAESVGRGVTLGLEEAARTGTLIGRGIASEMVVDVAAAREAAIGAAAIIGGVDDASAADLAGMAEAAGVLFVDIGSRADALRASCRPGVFHVEASQTMYAAAAADAPAGTDVVLWHPALERFGAAQLCDRFRARFGTGMDGAAWAGWMAVKVLWEASLRSRSTEPAALRAYLERPATQFDGHKGRPLFFRSADHQLAQPLYRVSGGEVVDEVPHAGEADASARETLDRFGATGAPGCADTDS